MRTLRIAVRTHHPGAGPAYRPGWRGSDEIERVITLQERSWLDDGASAGTDVLPARIPARFVMGGISRELSGKTPRRRLSGPTDDARVKSPRDRGRLRAPKCPSRRIVRRTVVSVTAHATFSLSDTGYCPAQPGGFGDGSLIWLVPDLGDHASSLVRQVI